MTVVAQMCHLLPYSSTYEYTIIENEKAKLCELLEEKISFIRTSFMLLEKFAMLLFLFLGLSKVSYSF